MGNDNQGVRDEIMTTVFVKEELLARQLVHTLYTSDTAHTTHCTQHNTHCTHWTPHITAHIAHCCYLHSAQLTQLTQLTQCTLHNLHCTQWTPHILLLSALCTAYIAQLNRGGIVSTPTCAHDAYMGYCTQHTLCS